MIGSRLRTVLRFVALAVIALAPLLLLVSLVMGVGFAPAGGRAKFFIQIVWSSMLPVIHSGVLLILLGIDERMQSRASLAQVGARA